MRVGTVASLALLAILLLPGVSAYTILDYSADYDIDGSQAMVSLQFALSEEASQFRWALPYDASEVAVSAQNYTIRDTESARILEINERAATFDISYITSSLVDSSSDHYFLLDLSGVKAAERSVFLKLPENAKLKYALTSDKPSVIPKTDDVATDGRRLIIRWSDADFDRSNAIMVIYEMPRNPVALVIAGFILVAVLAGGAAYYYAFRKHGWVEIPAPEGKKQKQPRQKQEAPEVALKKELTRNLFEDEKLIVETLLAADKHELWQKQLELRTKIPKVRLSRKIRSLEAKGLVEKIPYGNTNHIRLKSA